MYMRSLIYDDDQIKSKVGRLKRDTKIFRELLNSCSGYGWDPITNTITCLSDIWTNYVKVSLGDRKNYICSTFMHIELTFCFKKKLQQKKEKNEYISKYRYQGLKDFDLLNEIFGN